MNVRNRFMVARCRDSSKRFVAALAFACAQTIIFLTAASAQTTDFGDAPDSYLTRAASGGARHTIAGPRIGNQVDAEADAASPLNGTGDDITGSTDYEDGITVGTLTEGVTSNISVNVQNTSGHTNIVLFADWDGNGTFSNTPPERMVASTTVDGTVNIAVTPPIGAAAANSGLTFLRVRVSTAAPALITPGGALPNGEVEDVFVPIQVPPTTPPSVRFLDDIRVGKTRRIALMGTSLSTASPWSSRLESWLTGQALNPSNVSLVSHAVFGKSSEHGISTQLPELKATLPRPDVVFIEFAINDAGTATIQQSRDNLNLIIDDLKLFNPDIEIVLMTMSNTIDVPGSANASVRPNLHKYYQGYRDVAAQRNLLLIDHFPNWINLFNADLATWNSYMPDGLHPNVGGADNVIVPELSRALEAASMMVVDKEIPVINWTPPAPITFGTALGGTQLSASVSVPGTLTYTPAGGTILGAGIHTLTAAFVPTNTATYANTSESVNIVVNKATPTITWPNPPGITYGMALSATHLNAVSAQPGTFAYSPPLGTVLDAGNSRQLQVTLPASANFSAATRTVSIDVAPAPLTVIADDKNRAPGQANPPFTASYSGFVNGDTSVSNPPTLSSIAGLASTPGTYAITVTGGSDSNYSLNRVNGTLTIGALEVPRLTWASPSAFPYGTALGGTHLNATANVPGTFTYSPAGSTILNAGIQTLTATFAPTDTTRYASATKSVTVTVGKATPAITWNAPSAITYGTALGISQLNAATAAPGNLAYAPPAGSVLGVGNAQRLQVTLPESLNFVAATATVNIDVIPAQLTITADNKQRGPGQPNPLLTASYSGFVNGDTAISNPPTLSTTAVIASTPGSYAIAVTGGGDPHYNLNYVNGTLIVTELEGPVLTWSPPSPITYGTSLGATQLNATASVPGTFTYSPASGTVLGAGIHSLTASFAPADSTCYASTSASVTIIVNKATPAITWSAPTAVTYGTALGAVQLNASADAPGTLYYTPASGTILDAGNSQQLQATLPESANHVAATAMVTINVNPATLIVTADDKKHAVGESNPPLTANYSGFVNGESTIATPPTLSTAANSGSPAGSYAIVVTGGADPNYTISGVDGTLTVTAQQVPLVTWSSPANVTYGTALGGTHLNASSSVAGTFSYSPASGTVLDAGIHTLTVTFTPTDTVTYTTVSKHVAIVVDKAVPTNTWDTPSSITYGTALGGTQLNAVASIPGSLYYTPAAGTVLDTGIGQLLQATLPESKNYTAASATVLITVTPAPLMITANDEQRAAGEANPSLTASYSGFVNGDTAPAALPALSTAADTQSAPGNYPITVTGGSDPNYTITRVNGILSIRNKVLPVITWANPATLTYGTPLGSTQLNATASAAGTFSYLPPAGTMLDAGIRTLTATFSPTDTTRYATTSRTVSLIVDKATPTITWNTPGAIAYGTPLGTTQLNATTNGFGTLVYVPGLGTLLEAGVGQTLQVAVPESANFEAATASVSINVNPAPLTITADDQQRAPGESNPLLTARFSGFVNGDTTLATLPALSTPANSSSAPGTYPITVTGGADPNYSVTRVNGVLTIASKTVPELTWADPSPIVFGTALSGTQLNATSAVVGTFSYLPASGTGLGAGIHSLTATFNPTDTSRYAATSRAVHLVVEKAMPTITWGTPSPITYGTPLGTTKLNATTSAPGAFSYTPPVGTVLPAGIAQQLQATLPESANYLVATANVTIDVAPAPLTITADDKQRGPGLTNPPLTATYSGIVNGDTAIATAATLSTTAAVSSAPGFYPIMVTGGSDPDYTITRINGTLGIAAKEIPVITWNSPTNINYGTQLNSTQLNATAPVPGTFTYVPASGTLLGAGTHTLTTYLIPTDTARFASPSKTVTITVDKASPTINWSNPAPIVYGTALGSTQLDASSTAPGTLLYTPPLGTVLNVGTSRQLQVSLPASANYTVGNATVTIQVNPATLTVTANDKQRSAGVTNPPLTASYSGLVNGDTAPATLPTLTTTAVLSSAPGTYPIIAAGGSDPNYTVVHVNGTLTVAQKELPILTWSDPLPITFAAPLTVTQLNATASVAGAFTYNPPIGTVLGAGVHTLTASFAPTEAIRYENASATVNITVNKATPVISWPAPNAITFGTALNAVQLNATTAVQGTLTYTPAANEVLGAGVHPLMVQFSPVDTANYATASATVSLAIAKAVPVVTWATPDSITFGTTLDGNQLEARTTVPGTFSYTPASGELLGAGIHTLTAVFSPTDSANYGSQTSAVTITVNKATPIISWTPDPITFGTPLGASQLNASSNVAGDFTYFPAAGHFLDAGTRSLTALFSPTDADNYTGVATRTTLTVNKAVPIITWNNPAAITYGTPLDDSQLNASANVPGTFAYNPVAGTLLGVGKRSLSTVFTPNDLLRYATATATATITIVEDISPLQNQVNFVDVLADGVIDERDLSVALILINTRASSDLTYPESGLYPDVDGDRIVTHLDVDEIVRRLPESLVARLREENSSPQLPGNALRSTRVAYGPTGFKWSIIGEPGRTYDLQYARSEIADVNTGLVWSTIKSGLSSLIVFEESDPVRKARPDGFYRLIRQIDDCDFDRNGDFGSPDIDILAKAIRDGNSNPIFDLDEDGTLGFPDLERLVQDKLKFNTSLGDISLNGSVGLGDAVEWLIEFRKMRPASGWATGDFDGNGITAEPDLFSLARNFGSNRASFTEPGNNQFPWQNPEQPEDVNDDGTVDQTDAVIIIKRLNQLHLLDGASLRIMGDNASAPYIDPNGDGALSVSDAVRVNHFLNPKPYYQIDPGSKE